MNYLYFDYHRDKRAMGGDDFIHDMFPSLVLVLLFFLSDLITHHQKLNRPVWIMVKALLQHPLLKPTYTGHEKTSVGNLNFLPRLAETKQDQQFLEKSGLQIFLGCSRFSSVKIDQKMALGGGRLSNTCQTTVVKYTNLTL